MFKQKNKKSKLEKVLPNNQPVKIKKVEIKINPQKILIGVLVILLAFWIFGSFSVYVKKNLEISLSQAIADIKEIRWGELRSPKTKLPFFIKMTKWL